MKLKNLRWVILLMSLALVALVIFQFQWVRGTLNANNEQFDQQVWNALNETVHNLFEEEVLESALSSVTNMMVSVKDEGLVMGDSSYSVSLLGNSQIQLFKNRNRTITEFSSDSITFRKSLVETRFTPHLDIAGLKSEKNDSSCNESEAGFIIEEQAESIILEDSEKSIFISQNDSSSEGNVFYTLFIDGKAFSEPKTIQERINTEALEQELTASLENQGIDIPFSYGVIDRLQDSIVLSNEANFSASLVNSPYNIELFRNDIFNAEPALLSIDFPNKNLFLLRQLATSLTASILLVGVIVFCFVYAVRTIWKQKKLSEIKNDFINNMTHEFKTPVATVALAVEALQDQSLGDLPSMRERYLGVIRDENTRLGMQVEKVLQIATLDRKDFSLKIERLDVHSVIRQALEKINLQVEKRQGEILTSLEAATSEVEADPLHLSNIIYNLLDNANKYSPTTPQIKIATTSQEGGLWVSVSDKGIGMTREVLNRIFEKFYRVPTGNVHDVKGFGLGLAYVKTMVEAHQGSIRVKSQPNNGSLFEFFIPFKQHG